MKDNEKHNGFKIFGDDDPEGATPAAEKEGAEEILLTDDGMIARDSGGPGSPAAAATKPPASAGRGLRGVLFFILVLAFAAMGGGGYLAWDHVNQRLNQIERAGIHEVADLSTEIDERMAVFSTQFAAQHAEMQMQLSALRESIEESAEEQSRLQTALTGTRETLSDRIEEMENRTSGLSQRLETDHEETNEAFSTLESRVASISDALTEAAGDTAGMASAIKDIRVDLEAVGLRIDAVAKQVETATQDEPDGEVMARVEALQQEMDRRFGETNDLMERQITDLEDEIAALEAMMKSLRDLATGPDGSSGIIEQELR